MQPNTNDCGYYVIKNMRDIVYANIINSWMKVYHMFAPYIFPN